MALVKNLNDGLFKTTEFPEPKGTIYEDIVYVNLHDLDFTKADSRMIFGSRSGGKTTGCTKFMLEEMQRDKECMYLRRTENQADASARKLFDNAANLGWVEKYGAMKFKDYCYFTTKWVKADSEIWLLGFHKEPKDDEPTAVAKKPTKLYRLCHVKSVDNFINWKSIPFPKCDNMFFDEFMDSKTENENEFMDIQHSISTVFRERPNCVAWFFGNTVATARSSPVFTGFSVDIHKLKVGLSVYEYRELNLKTKNYDYTSLAVYYYGEKGQNEASRSRFAFGNGVSKMLTDGQWESARYPKKEQKMIESLPEKYFALDAIRFNKDSLNLYCYQIYSNKDNFLYITDERIHLKKNKFNYITIYYGPTIEWRNYYNIYTEGRIKDICASIARESTYGHIFFSNDLSGEDYNNAFCGGKLPVLSQY